MLHPSALRSFVLTLPAFLLTLALQAQSVGLGTETPNASAIFDISSTDKGILVPRMTTAQRTAIAAPATGLLVFDLTTGSFWYYNNMAWTNLAGGTPDKITDADNDTKVQVEKTADEDIFRLDLAGTERLVIRKGTGTATLLEPMNSNENIFMGISSGALSTGPRNVSIGSFTMANAVSASDNTALGYYALKSITSGSNNVAIGTNALEDNTTGPNNTAIGFNALNSNVANERSTAIGQNAMQYADNRSAGRPTYNTGVGYGALRGSMTPNANTGQHNTAVGDITMETITSGSYNVAMGSRALQNLTGGSDNTAIGHAALASNKANSRSTAIGEEAMYAADDRTTGRSTYNTAVGYQALMGGGPAAGNTGQSNTAVGDVALRYNTTGNNNTSVGADCLFNNSTGSNNTAMGRMTLIMNTTGASNTGIGFDVMNDNTIGHSNTALGSGALNTNVDGDQNCAVGVSAYFIGPSFNNTTCIGYNSGAQVNASNRIEIGNTSVSWIGGEVTWGTYSDARIKKNVRENVPGLDFINRLRPVTYNLDIHAQNALTIGGKKDEAEWPEKYDIEKETMTGFIAQEVEAAAQAAGYDFSGVQKGADEVGLYSVKYAEFVVPLVKAVQEQQAMIDTQAALLQSQQTALDALLARVAELEQARSADQRLPNETSPKHD